MAALPSLPPLEPTASRESRQAAFAQLRSDLVRRFPGAVALTPPAGPSRARDGARLSELRRAAFLWVETSVGHGGLAWLAAWTLLRLADDPLARPALWIDTHNTLTPGDLVDLEGRLVVVRPADPHEAHVAADIALRAGSFSLVALEMHRALHPTPLGRLARLASTRRAGSGVHNAPSSTASTPEESHTPLVLWGEPPPFVAPPSGIARTSFADAVAALLADPRVVLPTPADVPPSEQPDDSAELPLPQLSHFRAPHTTDRLRPLDRAADRRPSPPSPRADRSDLVDSTSDHEPDRDDDAPFPFTRSRSPR
ncbi:MAG: hypothetical protein HYV09_34470 [Deltaproteobacteria bacterium]|nr:hypothetical protein [Deltaproteobacteria bacterium]